MNKNPKIKMAKVAPAKLFLESNGAILLMIAQNLGEPPAKMMKTNTTSKEATSPGITM